jgi:hypothetical protein
MSKNHMDHRRSQRVHAQLPVIVQGKSTDGTTFAEGREQELIKQFDPRDRKRHAWPWLAQDLDSGGPSVRSKIPTRLSDLIEPVCSCRLFSCARGYG